MIIRMPSCIKIKDVVYHRMEMCNRYGFMDFGCPQVEGLPGPRGLPGQPGPMGPMGPMGLMGLMGPIGRGGSAGGTETENTPEEIPEETIRTFLDLGTC